MNSHLAFECRRTWLAKCLAALLVFGPWASVLAQAPPSQNPDITAPAKPMSSLPTVESLKLLVLAGKDGQNDLQRRVMSPLVVQVLDQNARPVEGAEVVFRFPQTGPGAVFGDSKPSQKVITNADGQAAATNWTANPQVGRFEVNVTAMFRNEMGVAKVPMENVPVVVAEEKTKKKGFFSRRSTKIALIAGAAGAVAAAVLLNRGNGGGSTVVIVAPGAPTIGGPR